MFMTIKNFSQKSKKSLGFFLMIFIFYEVNYNLSQKEGKFWTTAHALGYNTVIQPLFFSFAFMLIGQRIWLLPKGCLFPERK